jgi:opacity protein-like surface antigen
MQMNWIGKSVFAFVMGVGLFGSGAVQAEGLKDLKLVDPYLRFSIGMGSASYSNGKWHPPGTGDPDVFFDLNGQKPMVGSIALGGTMAPGVRGELALTTTNRQTVTGTWTHTVPTVAGPHADITNANVRSTALMANAVYAPMEITQPGARVQPFILGGLGLSANKVGDWTRTNAAATQPVRTFEGRTSVSLAWTVGLGASIDVSRSGSKPVFLEATVQYIDFGTAKGGGTPLPGSGTSVPITPLQFKHSAAVASLGLRIPF